MELQEQYYFNNDEDDIIGAVMRNDALTVEKFLTTGYDPNYAEDSENMTLLHIAVTYNAGEVMLTLLSAGANVHLATAYDNYTPIDLAESIQSPYMELLRRYVSH